MTKLNISSAQMRSAINCAKIVKPVFGDFSIFVNSGLMKVSSMDKRKSITYFINHDNNSDLDYEFFLPLDRIGLFDSELDNLDVNISEKGLTLKYQGNGTTRSAVLKRRAPNSKRPSPPGKLKAPSPHCIPARVLDDVLHSVSCSASIKETHTEEDMRVNQIHFYADQMTAFANARFHATFVKSDHINFDLSIISSDIPIIRNFCGKTGDILIHKVGDRVSYEHSDTGSFLQLKNIDSPRPVMKTPDFNKPKSELNCDLESFKKAVRWSAMTLEGTQRVTLSAVAVDGSSLLEFKSGDTVLTSFPLISLFGDGFSADFPIKILSSITDYLFSDTINIKFGVPSLPDILLLQQEVNDVQSYNYIRSMKSK